MPIITTRVGGNPEIIEHNKNGLLVPPADFSALAENIINLAQNKTKQAEFSRNCLEAVKRFDLKRMIAETERSYCGN